MSEEDHEEPFLSRWSRRKRAAREAEPVAPVAAEPPVARASDPQSQPEARDDIAPIAKTPLPEISSLEGLASEYQQFLQPEVDEALRRGALKKLFADPHFNVMDGLDTYIDDYTKTIPIPPDVLRRLTQAAGLFLFDETPKPGETPQPNETSKPEHETHTQELTAVQQKPSEEAGAAPEERTNCPTNADLSDIPAPERQEPVKDG
jgi:hypothetical protein